MGEEAQFLEHHVDGSPPLVDLLGRYLRRCRESTGLWLSTGNSGPSVPLAHRLRGLPDSACIGGGWRIIVSPTVINTICPCWHLKIVADQIRYHGFLAHSDGFVRMATPGQFLFLGEESRPGY